MESKKTSIQDFQFGIYPTSPEIEIPIPETKKRLQCSWQLDYLNYQPKEKPPFFIMEVRAKEALGQLNVLGEPTNICHFIAQDVDGNFRFGFSEHTQFAVHPKADKIILGISWPNGDPVIIDGLMNISVTISMLLEE